MQRTRQRSHGGRQRRGAVGAGRGDHAGGERGGVHAVLGGRDPVGVDRLHVVGVGLAAPADQEALGDRARPRRCAAAAPAAGRRRAPTGPRTRAPSPRRARGCRGPPRRRCRSAAPKPHSGASIASADCTSTRVVARAHGQRVRFGGGQAGFEVPVDQQAPDLLVGDRADEVLDVDAAVAQRATLFVGLRDLGGEGDDAFEARLDLRLVTEPRSWHSLSELDA